jgi:hypothetical protein
MLAILFNKKGEKKMSYFEPTPEEKKAQEKESAKFGLIMIAIIIGLYLFISGLDAIKEHKTFKQWLASFQKSEVTTQAKKV